MTARESRAWLNVLTFGLTVTFLLWGATTEPKDSVVKSPATDSVRMYVEEYGCWVDEAPAGVVPTHVIYRTERDVAKYADTGYRRDEVAFAIGGRRMTDKAIEQAVFGVDHGFTDIVFCPPGVFGPRTDRGATATRTPRQMPIRLTVCMA